MRDTDVTLIYMSLTQQVPGIKCPKCGAEYLTEKVVMTTVQGAESIFEGK
jgi:predicted nucleic-acid-binding Zn-ribbon protein